MAGGAGNRANVVIASGFLAGFESMREDSKWKDIAMLSGPPGLRLIRGFNDEALSGKWNGYRSSRLGLQYRVFYRTVPDEQLFQVVEMNAQPWLSLIN